jgi:hypothetical protein
MKSAKIEMNKGLLEAWLEAVHENGLPVNIQTGREYNDCNGDRTVEVVTLRLLQILRLPAIRI